MSRKFKYEIGTRVIHGGFGKGTIIDWCPNSEYCSYLIEFDKEAKVLHNGQTTPLRYSEKKKPGKMKRCWWCDDYDFEPITTEFDWNAFINDKIAVHLDTQEKWNAFMKECEKRGLNWFTEKATEKNYFPKYENELAVSYGYSDDCLGYCTCDFYRNAGWSICTYEISTESKPASWKVIIEGNGDVTTAKYIEGKNLVKTETVKRYYTDEYSVFKAIEALNNKLFDEEPKVAKVKEPKFKPGDLVEIIENNTCVPTGLRGHIVRNHPDIHELWLIDFHAPYSFTHSAGMTGEPLPEPTGYYLKEKHIKKVEK